MKKNIDWGLFRRRECLAPTWRGWLLIILIVAVLSVFLVREIRPFLAVTEPVAGGLLVVEGWIPDVAMEAAVSEFKRHRYEKICVTGGPIFRGAILFDYSNFAERGTATLLKLGIDPRDVQPIPSGWVSRDRTYAEAVALRKWMQEKGLASRTVHLITDGPHSRRSRMLFQRALGSGVTVGVTSVPSREYDPERWWLTSAGVRDVIGETIAYAYARLFTGAEKK
jgi:uncharacterized SAM-binding protein YcdF (DUF218 family)